MLNDQTFEFSQSRLRLKDSLRFQMRQSGGSITYLVEDEVTGRFFRVGLAQYTFMTMLDGNRTVSTALMKTATLLREHAIDETEAASLCKWRSNPAWLNPKLATQPRDAMNSMSNNKNKRWYRT